MRWITFLMFVVGAFAAPLSMAADLGLSAQQGTPQINMSEKGWDFGERIQGVQDEKTIVISNDGDAELILKKIDVTCGCIFLDKTPRRIKPGGTFNMVLKLDTRRGEGEIKKFVIVHTNDPKREKIEMPMTGNILPIWSISTRQINIGSVKNGAPFETSFTINVRKGHDVKLKQILTHSGFLVTKPERFENKDGSYGWKVRVTLNEHIQTGYFEDLVAIQTDDKAIPQRAMRLFGEITSSTKMTPNKLNFGVLVPGKKKTLTVRLEKEQGTGLQVIETHCKDKTISTSFKEITKGKVWEIEVTVDPAEDVRDLRGRLQITVEEPGGVVLNVDYYGRILLP